MRAPFVMMQGLRALGGFENGEGEMPVDVRRFMSDVRGLGLGNQKALARGIATPRSEFPDTSDFLVNRAFLRCYTFSQASSHFNLDNFSLASRHLYLH